MMRRMAVKCFMVVTSLWIGMLCVGLNHLEAKEEIVIGNMSDLTGGAAAVGIPHAAGRQDYFNLVNEKGGVQGYKIKSILLDDKHTITDSTRNFNRFLMSDGAVAILGFDTGATRALQKAFIREGIVWLAGGCAADLVDPKEYPWTFILSPTYTDQQCLVLDYIKEQGAKSFTYVRNELEGWKTAVDDTIYNVKYHDKIGLQLKEIIVMPIKASDATSQMLRAKALNADYVVTPNEIDTMIVTLRDGIKVGMDPKRIIGSSVWSSGPLLGEKIGKAGDGFMSFRTSPDWDGGSLLVKDMTKYIEAHPGSKQYLGSDQYTTGWMQGIVFTKALETVIKNNNGKIPSDLKAFRKNFRDALEGIKGPVFGEDQPSIDYSDHKGWLAGYLARLQDGKFVAATKVKTLK